MESFKDQLSYDPDTGEIHWKISSGKRKAGDRAGSLMKSGYMQLGINGWVYKAHRIAWYLYYGEWPDGDIDHVNRDRADNRIENLRIVSKRQNTQNSGVFNEGTGKHNGKWRARISIDGRQKHIGYFDTEEQAKEAYKKEAINQMG